MSPRNKISLHEHQKILLHLFGCFKHGALERGAMADCACYFNYSKVSITLIWAHWTLYANSNLGEFPN